MAAGTRVADKGAVGVVVGNWVFTPRQKDDARLFFSAKAADGTELAVRVERAQARDEPFAFVLPGIGYAEIWPDGHLKFSAIFAMRDSIAALAKAFLEFAKSDGELSKILKNRNGFGQAAGGIQ